MTVFVDDTTLRDARDRAARLQLGPAEQQRWRDVVAYGAARRPDPNAERSAVLRELLSLPGADDRAVLDAAARLLSAAVTGDAGPTALATQVHALCLRWFDEDVKEAAPLLELFTGHHRDPEGGPPQADPELVSKLAQWLARRAGAGARIENVSRHLRRVQPAHARRALDGRARCGADRAGRHVRHRGPPRGRRHADPAGARLPRPRRLVGGDRPGRAWPSVFRHGVCGRPGPDRRRGARRHGAVARTAPRPR